MWWILVKPSARVGGRNLAAIAVITSGGDGAGAGGVAAEAFFERSVEVDGFGVGAQGVGEDGHFGEHWDADLLLWGYECGGRRVSGGRVAKTFSLAKVERLLSFDADVAAACAAFGKG